MEAAAEADAADARAEAAEAKALAEKSGLSWSKLRGAALAVPTPVQP